MLRPGADHRGGSVTTLDAATRRLLERLRPESVPPEVGDVPVVAPRRVEEAAEVLAFAGDRGLVVGFVGGGTQLDLGGRIEPDVWVSTAALNRIVDHQVEDLTLVVQAGVPVADVEVLLADHAQSAILPETPGAATVGGVVAAGVSGYRRLRYGPTRDRVLEVVLATGYGKVVRAGGRVVKNVTGYDLSRLAVGSMGALGLIGEVCLKLWPIPRGAATVAVDDPEGALAETYRPLAVLETEDGSAVYLTGTPEQVAAQTEELGGVAEPGHRWPDPIDSPMRFSVRVTPRHLAGAVRMIRAAFPEAPLRAQHGVGEVTFGVEACDLERVVAVRHWAEGHGGAMVILAAPPGSLPGMDPWGAPPAAHGLQVRVKEAFDPHRICNPGKLPGGL